MEEKTGTTQTIHTGFWAEPALIAAIDLVAAKIAADQGIPVSRSAALRMLVTQGLERWEDGK